VVINFGSAVRRGRDAIRFFAKDIQRTRADCKLSPFVGSGETGLVTWAMSINDFDG
jgi:hypothetical protein